VALEKQGCRRPVSQYHSGIRRAMSLAPGVRLGPYEVLSAIGAGGMGEVYRARDPRLGRDVAIKVLPAAFSADPDRLRRIEQEARAAAALNHPNILVVYDVSTRDGAPYVVSELLEGETLRKRLQHGRLDTAAAIHFAVQIADALDAVHHAGIVHGDLKPSNVIVTKAGVKLIDFGLARMAHHESSGYRFGIQGLPVETASIGEEPNFIGSLPYMAPEQLDGRPIDARTDIFAFGAVLYEMLTGQRLFAGHTVGSTIAGILSAEPRSIREANPTIPVTLERLVSTCLANDPDNRWESARDLKRALEWIAADLAGTQTVSQSRQAPLRGLPSKIRTSWLAAGMLGIVTVGAVIVAETSARRPMNPIAPIQLVIEPPAGTRFSPSASLLSVSPDGRQIAFLALGADGINHVWIRPLESSEAREVPGTDNALGPFWSPDGRVLGFFASNTLKIVDVDGGPVQRICDALTDAPAGTWNRDGVILFSTGTKGRPGIYRVSVPRGPATPVRVAAEGDRDSRFLNPLFLPDGRHFVYRQARSNSPASDLFVGSLDSSKDRPLLSVAADAIYTPPSYLVFRREDTLLAQPFDSTTVALTGQPVPVAHDVGYNPYNGRTMFSVSADTLAYRPRAARQLMWFDRLGHREGTVTTTGSALGLALSPDGLRLAVTRADPATGTTDVWVMDLHRGVSSRLTSSSGNSYAPIWSPDGQHLLFGSKRGDAKRQVFEMDVSGTRAASLIAEPGSPRDWSRDGHMMLYGDAGKLFAVSASGVGAGRPLELRFTAPGTTSTGGATFSPDGRWIAYSSNESGQDQVFVRSFPGGQHKSQLSSAGGTEPQWRGDGQELYYLASDGHIVAVSIAAHRDTLEIGPPRPLFATQAAGLTLGILGGQQYAVTRDGQRFLVNEPVQEESTTSIIVVVNWRAALTR
jgi:serine/threonine protein kinase/Tol biopolymer transport system component